MNQNSLDDKFNNEITRLQERLERNPNFQKIHNTYAEKLQELMHVIPESHLDALSCLEYEVIAMLVKSVEVTFLNCVQYTSPPSTAVDLKIVSG